MDCGNRGLAEKLLAKITNNRLTQVVESTTSDSQSGFWKHRGTADMIFTLRQLMEKALEQDRELYIIFVDLQKAFDEVDRLDAHQQKLYNGNRAQCYSKVA